MHSIYMEGSKVKILIYMIFVYELLGTTAGVNYYYMSWLQVVMVRGIVDPATEGNNMYMLHY